MKGNHLVKTPGEFYSPTPQGVVVSADGVRDYILQKSQEQINAELTETATEAKQAARNAVESAATMENIASLLRDSGSQYGDIATFLESQARLEQNERDIQDIQDALDDYADRRNSQMEYIILANEQAYEQLVQHGQIDNDVFYIIPEEA